MSTDQMIPRGGKFAVIDLETTGFSHAHDCVIEVAAVKISRGRIGPVFHTLIYTDTIPWYASRVHGIYAHMVQDAPSLAEVRPLFQEFVRDHVLVGHNIVSFDLRFLCHAFGVAADRPVIDTLRWSRQLFPHERSHCLERAAERFGITSSRFHRAREDALVTARLFLAMRDHRATLSRSGGKKEVKQWRSGRKN